MPRSPLSPIGRPAPPRSGPSPSYVRLTLAPDEDVEVRAGIRLADLRPTLAQTLGRSDLLHVPHGAYINAKLRAKAAAGT